MWDKSAVRCGVGRDCAPLLYLKLSLGSYCSNQSDTKLSSCMASSRDTKKFIHPSGSDNDALLLLVVAFTIASDQNLAVKTGAP